MAETVAIIGAGVAGLTCAQHLQTEGWAVTVLEKSRGPGGRAATRRQDTRAYDHGAQFFTARDAAFQAQVRRWEAEGVVARWRPRLFDLHPHAPPVPHDDAHPRYVGVPRMSHLARSLSHVLTLCTGVQAAAIRAVGPGALSVVDASGEVVSAQGTAVFSRVVVAVPPAQAVPLLEAVSPALAAEAQASAAGMTPCLAAMVTFSTPLAVPFDAAWLHGPGPLAWIARDSSKPGRPPSAGGAWILHARPAWSQENLSLGLDEIGAALLAGLRERLGDLPATEEVLGHRWRYALAAPHDDAVGRASRFEAASGVGMCGDWLCAPRVEGAWQSGRHLAETMLQAAHGA